MHNTLSSLEKNIVIPSRGKHLDLNTDFGQSRDRAFFESTDFALLKWVSTVNMPCCVHDGDPAETLKLVEKAKQFHCEVGAHIGYPDPASHGYGEYTGTQEELYAWIVLQLGALQALMQASGLDVVHVRPHGALYLAFLSQPETARTVAEAMYKLNPWLILLGPAGPVLSDVAKKVGLRVMPELVLGKVYNRDGALAADRLNDSLAPQAVVEQARMMIDDKQVMTTDGRKVAVQFSSLHLSPRQPEVLSIAEKVSQQMGQPTAISLLTAGESGWL
ncbi:MAG: LamB/YcsF family protein [Candidatus Melainabacteria bacterium]